MKNKENEIKFERELSLEPSADGLISFSDFNSFFDGFLARKWLHLLEWTHPIHAEKSFPKTDNINRGNEKSAQAGLPGINQNIPYVSINSKTIPIRTLLKRKSRRSLLPFRYIPR